jgi:hypothetical protein
MEDYNNSLSCKITYHKSYQHLARWNTWTRTQHKSLSHKIIDHKSSQHLARWKTWTRTQHNLLSWKKINYKSARHLARWMTWTKTYLKSRLWLNSKTKIVGLSKAILPICKPTSRVQIREGRQSKIHYFMQCINSKYSEEERTGAIDQGFTCLAARTAQNLTLEGCPTSARLINGNRKYKSQYINKTVH